MTFVQPAAWSGFGRLTAAISFGATYYVGLVLLSIIMIALLVKAYRVWEEIHDVEEPDSPADLLDSFEQCTRRENWTPRNSIDCGRSFSRGREPREFEPS